MKVQKFPEKMADFSVDFAHPNRSLVQGYFEEWVWVNGDRRSFLTYIPENLEYCRPCLIVAIPSGKEGTEYAQESGLKKLADEEKLFLFLLESAPSGWEYG